MTRLMILGLLLFIPSVLDSPLGLGAFKGISCTAVIVKEVIEMYDR